MVKETVRSLQASHYSAFRAVVSDNGSAPDAAREVRAFVEGLGADLGEDNAVRIVAILEEILRA